MLSAEEGSYYRNIQHGQTPTFPRCDAVNATS
jgi:hypothetical protein